MAVNLIDAQKMQLAEHLVAAVQKYHLGQWRSHKSAGLANMFMRAYAMADDQEGFERWRELLWGRSTAAVPDAMSYSIVFDFYLARRSDDECKRLAECMARDGIQLRVLADIQYLCRKRMEHLCAILKVPVPTGAFDLDMISLESLKEDLGVVSSSSSSVTSRIDDSDLPDVNSIKVVLVPTRPFDADLV